MDAVYHETTTPTVANPFAYTTIPPIGRLLDLICNHLSIGGCFRPGNRQLADWLGYASASQMPALLSELACKGWIGYDRETGVITLRRDYRIDQSIRSTDRSADLIADDEEREDSALIDPIDRDIALSSAEYETDQIDRSIPQRMEDSCLTTTESDSEFVVVKEPKIPCAPNSISPTDHPILLLLAELGLTPGRGVFERGMAARTWTPQQIRDRWEFDRDRIKNSNGKLHIGIFWTAFIAGELAPARPDPNRPLDPADYANQPGFALGSDLPPPNEPESIRDRASRLLPPPTADTLKTHTRDWLFLQGRLGAGDTDQEALAALDAYRKAVRR